MHPCPEWKISLQHALCLPCRDDFLFATFAMHTPLTLFSSPLLQLLSNLIDASSPGVISTKKAQIQLNCKAGSQEPMIGKECLTIPHPQGAHLGCVSFIKWAWLPFMSVLVQIILSKWWSEQCFWSLFPSRSSGSLFLYDANTSSILYAAAGQQILFLL